MIKTLIIDILSFDNPEEYEAFEKKAKYESFDYCLSIKVIRLVKKLQAKWIIDGDDGEIDSFIKNLNLEKYIVK